MINLLCQLLLLKEKIALINLFGGSLIKKKGTKEIITNHFNKELIMTAQDEEIYDNSQICWICNE